MLLRKLPRVVVGALTALLVVGGGVALAPMAGAVTEWDAYGATAVVGDGLTLADGDYMLNQVGGYQGPSKTVDANSNTQWDLNLKGLTSDPAIFQTYQIYDNGTATGYWIAALYRQNQFVSDNHTCDIYPQKPVMDEPTFQWRGTSAPGAPYNCVWSNQSETNQLRQRIHEMVRDDK